MRNLMALSLLVVLGGCKTGSSTQKPPAIPYASHDVPLAGGTADDIAMDYLAFDPNTGFVWAPAGNTGAVYVVASATGEVMKVGGFPTIEVERNGKKRMVGPSSVTIGEGVVYVGNRGDSSVCSLESKGLTRIACGKLDSMPDGIAWVGATKEVWVTTPRDKSIRILDGTTLVEKARLPFEGEPEGYAVDATRGVFYTNLEDADRTLAIDVNTHQIKATWKPDCGKDGPHGLALDETGGFLMLACSTRVEVLDAAHDGAVLSTLDTGDGVDNLDFAPATHMLYAAAGKAARLTIAHLEDKGHLARVADVPTKPGARNAVVDAKGSIYVAHGRGAELVVVTPPDALSH